MNRRLFNCVYKNPQQNIASLYDCSFPNTGGIPVSRYTLTVVSPWIITLGKYNSELFNSL